MTVGFQALTETQFDELMDAMEIEKPSEEALAHLKAPRQIGIGPGGTKPSFRDDFFQVT